MFGRGSQRLGQGMLVGNLDRGARSYSFRLRIVVRSDRRQGWHAIGIKLDRRDRQAGEVGKVAAENVGRATCFSAMKADASRHQLGFVGIDGAVDTFLNSFGDGLRHLLSLGVVLLKTDQTCLPLCE